MHIEHMKEARLSHDGEKNEPTRHCTVKMNHDKYSHRDCNVSYFFGIF